LSRARLGYRSVAELSTAENMRVARVTAADIPISVVAANYLPLAGGTLTGTLSGTKISR
jgi:hypothetical protein